MVNEKKVILMTKIAMYENKEEKDLKIASRWFKVDYVTTNMLYTAVTTTIGYLFLVILYVLGNLERLFIDVTNTNFADLISNTIKYYIFTMVAFLIFSLVYYSIRYDRSYEKVRNEYISLKNLAKMSDKK